MKSIGVGAVALVTALGMVTGPTQPALAAGGKKAAAADAGKSAPDDRGNGRRIGLREALKVAVRQNPTLASETIDVAIEEAKVAESYGFDDWLFDAGANWRSSRTEAVPGQGFAPLATDSLFLTSGLTKPLVDGGRVGLRFDAGYARSETQFEIDIDGPGPLMPQTITQKSTAYNPKLTVSFFQPILRGFGEDTRNATRSLARANRNVQELERENSASSIVRDVVAAYWELAYSVQELEIRKQSLALAREQLRITQAGIDVGKLAKTDALAVEQAIAAREEIVFVAEQNVADRSIELRRLIGLEIGPGEIEIVATDRLEIVAREPDLDKSLASAMENNPQLKSVRALGKASAIEVAVTENGLLPQLDFTASGGPQGNSQTVGDAFSQLGTFDSFEVNAGLVFSVALGNHGAKGRQQQAQGRQRKVKLTEQDIRAQIAALVVRSVNVVRSAKKRMDVSAKSTTLAKQNVELEKARWEVGRSTNFNVLLHQDVLAQAQLTEARARTDYLKAVAVLDSLTGEILGRYGIELAKT